jgi:SAM-dependent methyltransferase
LSAESVEAAMAMPLTAHAWMTLGRLQRRRSRRRHPVLADARARWVAEHTPGRSFVDVGCMWNIHGGMCFLAEESGATRVTGFDGMAPTEEFAQRHRDSSSSVRFVQGDLHDPVSVDEIGVHDVVLCSGVIYHSPNPWQCVEHLHRICGDVLMIGSHTIPELPGMANAAVFYPDVPASHRSAFARVHGGHDMPGVTGPIDETPYQGFANMWWGLTPSCVEAMLRTAGFGSIERIATHHDPFVSLWTARKVEGEPIVPRPEMGREHAERLRATGAIPDF